MIDNDYYNPSINELELAYSYLAKRTLDYFNISLPNSKPECIIGLQRGGLITAVNLSHLLNVPMLVADYSHPDSVGDNKESHNQLIPTIPSHIKRIILVEDIVDTGNSANGLLSTIVLPKNCEVLIVTLFLKQGVKIINNTRVAPWRIIPIDAPFVNFPWEKKLQ